MRSAGGVWLCVPICWGYDRGGTTNSELGIDIQPISAMGFEDEVTGEVGTGAISGIKVRNGKRTRWEATGQRYET